MPTIVRKALRLFLAYFRLSKSAVCEMSNEHHDFHDYPDATDPRPIHFHEYTCARCGKQFEI